MKEEEIRKRGVFNRYLKLAEKEIRDFFRAKDFVTVKCPACSGRRFKKEFLKKGFTYVSCDDCATLFANPRPRPEALTRFYTDSPSARFWVNEFFKPVAEARRKKIFRPRAKFIAEIIEKRKKITVGDIGAGFGLFLEELREKLPGNRYYAIEPSKEMADICSAKKLTVINRSFEDIDAEKAKFGLLTAFELVEHLYDPALFFKKAHSLLDKKGLLFFTTLNFQGFDIQLLWERSKSIMPPHHLNFFSPFSIEPLMKKTGFKVMEISTPGRLDWDIVEGMIKKEGVSLGRFWDNFAKGGAQKAKAELQEWIIKNRLSSHMRILVEKA